MLISIEGDPQSPISRWHLCPKGADSYELLTHPRRALKVKYRRPYSLQWQSLDLETALDMIAERVWAPREETLVEKQDGEERRVWLVRAGQAAAGDYGIPLQLASSQQALADKSQPDYGNLMNRSAKAIFN